jgi:hypothetical protein
MNAGKSMAQIIAPFILLLAMVSSGWAQARGPSLEVSSEYARLDPFGGVVEKDRIVPAPGDAKPATAKTLELRSARNAYVSFQLSAKLPAGGPYSLSVRFPKLPQVEVDLFKAWQHFERAKKTYTPDALIPVKNPYHTAIPDQENKIPGQTAQVFWVDLWVPRGAAPGVYLGEALLQAGSTRSTLKIQLEILKAEVPNEDSLTIDHNSYGSAWLGDLYPKLRDAEGEGFYRSDAFFSLIHAYHRLFYEHRGTFHQLGYGHAGKVGPEFAPALTGSGREKRIASWDLFDRHYGPLLDGGAFAQTRRGPRPIPFVYLPINPEWPASFLAWGESGYEAEFVNVVREMEAHFRSKGWTHTKFEMFFNHKKRYKGFHWDGDETRFVKDDAPFREYRRLLEKAVPAKSPVQFVYRLDASWRLEDQFKTLEGVINFWVSSGTILSWLPEQLEAVKKRGDIVWTYSGPPSIDEASSAILEHSLRAWMWDINGYIHWLTVSPSQDPWFDSQGEGTALAYPGERFGINGPIPSIRLKIQRNLLQDIALLKKLEKTQSLEALRVEVSKRINGGDPKDWRLARPAMADQPPEDWSNATIEQAAAPYRRRFQNWAPDYWRPVRQYILTLADGGTGQ